MFAFITKSDEEILAIQNRGLLEEGVYPFIVKEVVQTVSKSQNPMLEVKIGVLDKDGQRVITDYLVAMDSMIFKLKHFCETLGFEKEYKDGKLDPAKCVGRSGSVLIGIKKGDAKRDGSGFYPDKNNVRDYVKPEAKPAQVDPEFNDDIKF